MVRLKEGKILLYLLWLTQLISSQSAFEMPMFIWSLWDIRGPRNHADHLSKQWEVFFCRLSFFFHELDCIVTVATLAYFSFLVRSKLDVLKCSEPPASNLVLNLSRFLFGAVTTLCSTLIGSALFLLMLGRSLSLQLLWQFLFLQLPGYEQKD